jgi:hypothetical protein
MQGLPKGRHIETWDTIIADGLTRRQFAGLGPLHEVPRPARFDGYILDPRIEESP